MTYTITDSIKSELRSYAPRFRKTAQIHSGWYNSDTRVSFDFSSLVTSWGRLVETTTIEKIDYEKPNLTMQAINNDHTFSEFRPESFFSTNSVSISECIVELNIYVRTGPGDGIEEQILRYLGRLSSVSIIFDESFQIAELTTIAEAFYRLSSGGTLTKQSGGRLEVPDGVWQP